MKKQLFRLVLGSVLDTALFGGMFVIGTRTAILGTDFAWLGYSLIAFAALLLTASVFVLRLVNFRLQVLSDLIVAKLQKVEMTNLFDKLLKPGEEPKQ